MITGREGGFSGRLEGVRAYWMKKSLEIILNVFGFTLDFCLGDSYNKTRNTHILWLKQRKDNKIFDILEENAKAEDA